MKEKIKISPIKKGSSDKVDDDQVEDENKGEEENKDYYNQ
jgi:hypothetical protein